MPIGGENPPLARFFFADRKKNTKFAIPKTKNMERQQVVEQIKSAIRQTDAYARTILYGSQARGDWNAQSDIDVLILIDGDKINLDTEQRYTLPLFQLEWQTGIPISPMVMLKKDWEIKKNKTPFYLTIQQEGIEL